MTVDDPAWMKCPFVQGPHHSVHCTLEHSLTQSQYLDSTAMSFLSTMNGWMVKVYKEKLINP
jgi:hypothetical protein